VAHQVDRAIGLGVRRGEEHLRMRLQPPELGDLRMDLSLRGGDLKVVFIAETPAAREALKAAMPELRGSLAEQGLKLEQFSVFVRGEGAFSRGFADRDQSPDTGRGRASQATATEAVEAAAPATRSRAAGLVDVFC
jgi:flagellar hook-length control protein FliK